MSRITTKERSVSRWPVNNNTSIHLAVGPVNINVISNLLTFIIIIIIVVVVVVFVASSSSSFWVVLLKYFARTTSRRDMTAKRLFHSICYFMEFNLHYNNLRQAFSYHSRCGHHTSTFLSAVHAWNIYAFYTSSFSVAAYRLAVCRWRDTSKSSNSSEHSNHCAVIA